MGGRKQVLARPSREKQHNFLKWKLCMFCVSPGLLVYKSAINYNLPLSSKKVVDSIPGLGCSSYNPETYMQGVLETLHCPKVCVCERVNGSPFSVTV